MPTVRRGGAIPSFLVALVALTMLGVGGHALAANGLRAPTITSRPANPTTNRTAKFTFTHPRNVRFDCALDGSSFIKCGQGTSGAKSYTNLAVKVHTFRVRAITPQARSATKSYEWKVVTEQPPPSATFAIAGSFCCLHPGVWNAIDVTFANSTPQAIRVHQLAVSVASSPTNCSAASNIDLQQAPISTSHTVLVPAHSTVHLALADRPKIQLKNLATNQDACQGQSFGLRYAGQASGT